MQHAAWIRLAKWHKMGRRYLDYSRLSRHHFGGISFAFHVFHPPFWVTLPSKKVPRCAPYGGRAPCFSHSASAQVLTEIRLWKQEADLSPRSAEGGGSWGWKLHGSSGCSWWIDVTLWQFQHSYGTSPFLVGNIYKWAMHGHARHHAILPAVPQPDLDGCEKWLPELVGTPAMQNTAGWNRMKHPNSSCW